MKMFDENPSVLAWSSEEHIIPYIDPMTGRVRRYFPDFWVRVRTVTGQIEEHLIEVKPAAQTVPPKKPKSKKPTKRYIEEVRTWGTNSSKWEAAEKFCAKKGWKFQIITEKHLGIAK